VILLNLLWMILNNVLFNITSRYHAVYRFHRLSQSLYIAVAIIILSLYLSLLPSRSPSAVLFLSRLLSLLLSIHQYCRYLSLSSNAIAVPSIVVNWFCCALLMSPFSAVAFCCCRYLSLPSSISLTFFAVALFRRRLLPLSPFIVVTIYRCCLISL